MDNNTHTKEPWLYELAPGETRGLLAEVDGTVIMRVEVTENSTAHKRLPQNLARIAAAIHGTVGIGTDLLGGFSPRFLASYPDLALRERQEAQAILRQLTDAATGVLQHVDGALPNRGWLRDNNASREALHALREALSKANASAADKVGDSLDQKCANELDVGPR